MYRRLAVLLVLALSATACTGEDAVESTTTSTTAATTTTTSTTTTVPPTTTTTIPPFNIKDAPPRLEKVIQQFYAYASGDAPNPPRMSPQILNGIKPASVKTPRSGVASVGLFKKDRVATVKMNDDIFLLVHNGDGWRIVGGKWPSISVPARWGPSPRLVAVVGSDARPGENILTTRTDSIHFVGLDGKGHGGIVGVPRDSWVPIAGGGRSKINAALSWVGPEGMMETFRDLSGLPVEGYVMTGFLGFEEMISSVLGGFELGVPYRMKDQAAKADLEAGRQIVDGDQALAFSRARKTLPNGDFDRSFNQGRVMLDVMKNLNGRGIMAIPKLLELSEPFMMTDLGPAEILTFAAQTVVAKPAAVPNVVLPGSSGLAGQASVVFLSDSASDVFADLADGRLGG